MLYCQRRRRRELQLHRLRAGRQPAKNPCGDPPAGVGGDADAADGGGRRAAQPGHPGTTGEPASLERRDPARSTRRPGAAAAGQSDVGSSDPNARRIVALRPSQPVPVHDAARAPTRSGSATSGWNDWEEIDRSRRPDRSVANFGWPCYEGERPRRRVRRANLNICENLYAAGTGAVVSPYYTYNHAARSSPATAARPEARRSPGWRSTDRRGNYPASYANALFFADYCGNASG